MPLDLISISPFLRYLRKDSNNKPITPEGWSCRTYANQVGWAPGLGGSTYEYSVGKDRLIKVYADPSLITRIEVNPARILHHGKHGGVIKNNDELHHAFQLLSHRLNDISETNINGPERWKFNSLEIGWNLSVPFEELERHLLSIKHPWVRNRPSHCRGKEITYKGSIFTLKVYNKAALLRTCREISGATPPMTRVEVVLKGKKLFKVTGLYGYNEPFSFDDAWGWFLKCLQAMNRPTIRQCQHDQDSNALAELCACALDDRYFPSGMSPLDFVMQGKSESTRYRFAKAVNSVRMTRKPWSLLDYFPSSNPTPVELLPPTPPIASTQCVGSHS